VLRWIKAEFHVSDETGDPYYDVSFEHVAEQGEYYEIQAELSPKQPTVKTQRYIEGIKTQDPVMHYPAFYECCYRFRVRVIDRNGVLGPWSAW
jgi:hypothetical protein